jgi:uncharacterized membrane protein YGL010W
MAREPNLLAWQWQTYARNHRNRANLLLHMAAVPAFIGGVLAAVTMAVHQQWFGALVALVFAALAFVAQGIGHKWEKEAPIPFDGPADFVSRVFVEQFITFPRFVLSGQWMRNMTDV